MEDKKAKIKGEILKNIDNIAASIQQGKDIIIKSSKDSIKIQSTKAININ